MGSLLDFALRHRLSLLWGEGRRFDRNSMGSLFLDQKNRKGLVQASPGMQAQMFLQQRKR